MHLLLKHCEASHLLNYRGDFRLGRCQPHVLPWNTFLFRTPFLSQGEVVLRARCCWCSLQAGRKDVEEGEVELHLGSASSELGQGPAGWRERPLPLQSHHTVEASGLHS